jgi:hypothetical protein
MPHDNPMRFVPLLPSSLDPAPWLPQGPVMLRWDGTLHEGWETHLCRGQAIHAAFLPGHSLVDEALEVLRYRLGLDFLVLPVPKPGTREAGFRLLGQLEALLEATSGHGIKLALHLNADAVSTVIALLREAHGEAIGFCWHPGLLDAELLADRIWCAVCDVGTDLGPLQALGYRWDMALAVENPGSFRVQAAAMEAAYPEVFFPAEMPATVLGRPLQPDGNLVFGRHWDRP